VGWLLRHLSVLGLVTLASAFVGPQARADDCVQRAINAGHYLRVEDLGEWQPLGDRTLLIWIPGTARAHLLHLSKALPGLQHAEVIDVVDSDKDRIICACGRHAILLDNGTGDSARINFVENLTERSAAELLRRHSMETLT
jgi:hypothetical protein